ncbi:hypothetical protein ACFVGM_09145 [Kitasatospora purpeofusca]|uniref:hypothetical protein n=1 Tax=Kitasatospora purpeofusca TaxID=67352 RepID=UPI0036B1DA9C
MKSNLSNPADRAEDEIGRSIADLLRAAENLGLEYTANGEIYATAIHQAKTTLALLDEQGAALARAAELTELADRLRTAALYRAPMEPDADRVKRLVSTQSAVAEELETTTCMLQLRESNR